MSNEVGGHPLGVGMSSRRVAGGGRAAPCWMAGCAEGQGNAAVCSPQQLEAEVRDLEGGGPRRWGRVTMRACMRKRLCVLAC